MYLNAYCQIQSKSKTIESTTSDEWKKNKDTKQPRKSCCKNVHQQVGFCWQDFHLSNRGVASPSDLIKPAQIRTL